MAFRLVRGMSGKLLLSEHFDVYNVTSVTILKTFPAELMTFWRFSIPFYVEGISMKNVQTSIKG